MNAQWSSLVVFSVRIFLGFGGGIGGGCGAIRLFRGCLVSGGVF